jgi:hypothetical protein
MRISGFTGLILLLASELCGADNVLSPREKADGWVLLFDGQSLNGWSSSVPEAAGRGRGPGGIAKQAKAPAPSGAAPSVGSNPRACSTPAGQAPVAAGASHWEVSGGTLSPCGDPAGYLTSVESYKDFVLTVDFRTGAESTTGGL